MMIATSYIKMILKKSNTIDDKKIKEQLIYIINNTLILNSYNTANDNSGEGKVA